MVLHCRDGSSLDLTFHYLTFFKIVAVQTKLRAETRTTPPPLLGSGSSNSTNAFLEAQTLLDCLMDAGDLGKESPNAANRFHVNSLSGEVRLEMTFLMNDETQVCV